MVDAPAPMLRRNPKPSKHARNLYMTLRAIGNNGMLTIDGMTGEFAPHIFVPGEGGERRDHRREGGERRDHRREGGERRDHRRGRDHRKPKTYAVNCVSAVTLARITGTRR